MSRPTRYSPELADAICQLLSAGQSLRKLCKRKDMPAKGTVIRWLGEDDKHELRDKYARAHEYQIEALAEECLEIADDAGGDYRTAQKDGRTVVIFDKQNVQRARLRIDARKWYAAKLAPKKYGAFRDQYTHALARTS